MVGICLARLGGRKRNSQIRGREGSERGDNACWEGFRDALVSSKWVVGLAGWFSEEMYTMRCYIEGAKGLVGKILTQGWGLLGLLVESGCSLPAFTYLVASSLEVYRLVLMKRRKVR